MADAYLAINRARLAEVPAAGERVAITELATHCRGAVFLDGSAHLTPAVEAAVERAVSGFDGGYCFGRLDVRSESLDAFMEGRFRVIEANGVTSEPAHVYDPRHSVWTGWRTLLRSWRLADEIGRANARRGARVETLPGILVHLLRRRG
jgi:hypothetical protein